MRKSSATLACAAFTAGALLLTACSSDNKTLVAVNGYNITKGELDAKLESQPAATQVVRQMLQQDLLFQYAKDNNIQVTDGDIDQQINQIKAQMSDLQLQQALAQQGMTMQDLRDVMRERVIVNKAISKEVNITPAMMQDYLNKNHALLDQPAQVDARHILVADLATANMIEAKLHSGGDFAALARQYSTDPGTKDKGGELGYFTQGAMVKQFSDVAFSLKPGQISQPVKSPYGWHIIQVEHVKPAQVATLANSGSKIRDNLLNAQEQIRVPDFMNNLMANAKITVADPAFAGAVPSPLPTAPPAPAQTPAPAPKPSK